jgi:hypothetical protein
MSGTAFLCCVFILHLDLCLCVNALAAVVDMQPTDTCTTLLPLGTASGQVASFGRFGSMAWLRGLRTIKITGDALGTGCAPALRQGASDTAIWTGAARKCQRWIFQSSETS